MKTKLYSAYNKDGEFVMTSSLLVMAQMFAFGNEAMDRVLRETSESGSCTLCFNRRNPRYESIVIREAK